MPLLSLPQLSSFFFLLLLISSHGFSFNFDDDLTVESIQSAFKQGTLSSRQLVQHYIDRVQSLNPTLHAVIELNPDALDQADRADGERLTGTGPLGGLHGVPVLLKDNIGTKDRLNTTAGSLALLGSVGPRDSTVVQKLREAGAVIFGKASINFRTKNAPSGWSARGGQGRVSTKEILGSGQFEL